MKWAAETALMMISAGGGYGIADYYITTVGSFEWWTIFLLITGLGSISIQILRD